MRKVQFANGEYYHIFNRGVDKRDIFVDEEDMRRFFQSMQEFNKIDPIGSIYEARVRRSSRKLGNLVPKNEGKLVDFICYCLNPNHYHFILRQLVEKGIEKFMHRLGLGYSNFFNKKYKRSGSLFQGTFKGTHIGTDAYLLHAGAYVNLNNRVHSLEGKDFLSSWREYIQELYTEDWVSELCQKEAIINQFSSSLAYKNFAEDALIHMRERKELEKLLRLEELGN